MGADRKICSQAVHLKGFMNFEIETKQYSANVDITNGKNGPELTVHSVIVTVFGVEVDVTNFMPVEAWDALNSIVTKKYEEAGGDLVELKAKFERLKEEE